MPSIATAVPSKENGGRVELPGDAREVIPKYPQDEKAEMQIDKNESCRPTKRL